MEKMVTLNEKPTLVFVFPFRGIGGVSLLFGRFADYFSNKGYRVSVIDYFDGSLAKYVSSKVEVVKYEDLDSNTILEFDYAIFQSMTPWSLFASLSFSPSTKLIFITTLVENFFTFLPGIFRSEIANSNFFRKLTWKTILRSEYLKSRSFIKDLIDKKSIFFLDTNIKNSVEEIFGLESPNSPLLPLFSGKSKYIDKFDKKSDFSYLNAVWVGRLTDFKIHSLNRVIEDLSETALNKRQKVSLTVVGSGNYYKKLNSQEENNFFSINLINKILHSKLENFLAKFDVLFAMGTSVLDGARLGLPVVCLDYSYKKIHKGYKYKYFHEMIGYCTAERIESSSYNEGANTMSKILEDLSSSELKNQISSKCFHHYNSKHKLCVSAAILEKNLSKVDYQWMQFNTSDYKNSLKFSMYDKLRG